MPIYEIGQYLGLNLETSQVVAIAFSRLQNREISSIEELLMAIHCIDTYGTESDRGNLTELLELSPLEEEVVEYRIAA